MQRERQWNSAFSQSARIFGILTCVDLDLFVIVLFFKFIFFFNQRHLPPQTHTRRHTYTNLASTLPLLAQQGGLSNRARYRFFYRAALSCRISLLTQSCHGLGGLKDINAKGQKKMWNSKNKPLVYSSACMLMSAWSTCGDLADVCFKMMQGVEQGRATPLGFAVMPPWFAPGFSNICGGDWGENVAEVRVFHHDILQGVAVTQHL